MTDVFVRSMTPPKHRAAELRLAMRELTLARWRMQEDAHCRPLYGTSSTFHMESKRYAEDLAREDIYIIADDDCLILGKNFVADGVRILRANPEYGLLTAVSVIENHMDLTLNNDVVERHSVGGVAFVRRGILKEFRACEPKYTDDTICAEITRAGYKTGVMPGVRMNHLGYGYSITTDAYWEA